jgi:hypothetical protein
LPFCLKHAIFRVFIGIAIYAVFFTH